MNLLLVLSIVLSTVLSLFYIEYDVPIQSFAVVGACSNAKRYYNSIPDLSKNKRKESGIFIGVRYLSHVTPIIKGVGPDGITPLSEYIDQMKTGLLLSDGTLVKKYQNGGTYFQMAQSIIHKGFICHVHSLYLAAGLCHLQEPTLNITTVQGKKYNYLSFSTKSFIN